MSNKKEKITLDYEGELFAQGYEFIGGIDEAGRGPLAGPVVAACAICDINFSISKNLEKVRDSKKISEKKRAELFDIIQEEVPEFGIGICDAQTIDRINILEATFLAMKKAIGSLQTKPNFILLDGHLLLPNYSGMQKCIKGGDDLVFSIAAASIIAKVTRDRMMREADIKYPQYGFAQHKGYGTKAHLEALRKHGPCEIHRKSFGPVARVS